MLKPRIRANVKWFSTRHRKGKSARKSSPQQIVGLRLAEFATLFRSRYRDHVLPDDDSGRDDIEPVIHHLAALRQPARRAEQWLRLWAPWMTIAEMHKIITEGIAGAHSWTADQLAWRYRITREERTMLGLTTIGAVDYGKAARTKRRKQRDRERKAAARRAAGAKPRAQYVAASLEYAKPWEAEGISRRTWYRRRNGTGPLPDTGPATA